MKVLNLLATGGYGGIETLCNSIDSFQKEDNYWCFVFKGGEIADKIKKRSPKKTFIFEYKKSQIIKIIKEIIKICKEQKIDIVVQHHGGLYINIIYYYLIKRLPNVKFIRIFHSEYEEKYTLEGNFIKRRMILYFLRKLIEKSDSVIFVSKNTQETYEKQFNLKDVNKAVVYNGIDKKFFNNNILREGKTKNKHYEIVYIGRLANVKGIDRLIKATKQLSKYDIGVTIVGDGEERKNLEDLVDNLKLTNIVKFVGFQSNPIEFLDKADIFVYPSIWKEAFGISVVEAMARGCIPLVSNRGGLPEVVGNNKKYLFDTEEELKEKLEDILNKGISIEDIQKMKEQASKFTIEKTIVKLEEEYKKTI